MYKIISKGKITNPGSLLGRQMPFRLKILRFEQKETFCYDCFIIYYYEYYIFGVANFIHIYINLCITFHLYKI